MKKHFLIRYTKKTGKINKTLEGLGGAMLKLWALQNTTKSTNCLIFDEDGVITFHTKGNDSGFPDVDKDIKGNIEFIVPGLLNELKAGV